MEKKAHILVIDGVFDQVVEDHTLAKRLQKEFKAAGFLRVKIVICAWPQQDDVIDKLA